MSNQLEFGGVYFGENPERESQAMGSETPFRMLIVGDFSGRGNCGVRQIREELAGRSTLEIDRDNFDDVLDRLKVSLDHTIVDSSNQPIPVRFRELDDFEPDRLFESVDLFEKLRGTRRQLLNESTFAQAAAEVRSWAGQEQQERPPLAVADSSTPAVPPSVNLNDLLESTIQQQQSEEASVTRWDEMIRQIVDPLIVAAPDPQVDTLVTCVDAAISQSMRQLLHHPDFQRLESAWRGVYLLIRRLETGRSLQIHLLDISRRELAEDMDVEDPVESGLYRLIVEQSVGTAGGQPWSAIIGCDSYGADADDVQVLRQLGRIAAAAGAPFIGSAKGQVVGCPNPEFASELDDWEIPDTRDNEHWRELRSAPEASSVELLWPRFLGRSPYGRETRPIEAFEFEELPERPTHSDYLWCSPAIAAALVLGQSFLTNGWNMQPGEINEVNDLPLCFSVDGDGDLLQLPCGELWLTDRGVDRIHQAGLVPVVSVKSQASIRVGSFCGLNGTPLRGRWS